MESYLTLEVIIGQQEEYPVDPVCILYHQLYFMVDVLVDARLCAKLQVELHVKL